MSSQAANRRAYDHFPQAPPARSAVVLERRRRERHLARLRRDLLEDIGAGFVLTLLTVSLTAGLGVIALLGLPLALLAAASFALERRIRSRADRGRRAREAHGCMIKAHGADPKGSQGR